MKKWIIPMIAVLLVLSACSTNTGGGEQDEGSVESTVDITVNGETIVGYYDVIDLVGIDRSDAEKIEKIDDWEAGPRYSFETKGTTARVYCNMDGTIHTIKVGVDIDLYKQGYEPWSIDNFLIDDDVRDTLMLYAEEAVTACLNYPSTADFPLFDWSFGREFNRYTVNSYVEAQNAFGVPSEMAFTAGFWVDEDQIKLIYLTLDGTAVLDESEDYPLPERETVEIDVGNANDGQIRIIDGVLGEYGEEVTLDSYEYIWYMIPAGKYEMTCNSKQCVVYVDKNEITKNSSGYVEMENVATYEMEYGETVEVVIGEDEHIFNTINADFSLKPVS